MPVILALERYDQWMLGAPDDAMQLVRTCGDPLAIELWFKGRANATLL